MSLFTNVSTCHTVTVGYSEIIYTETKYLQIKCFTCPNSS